MKKILTAILIMAGVVGLAYGGPYISGGAGGSSGTVTGATISGTLTADQVIVGAGTNSIKDGGAGLFATTSSLAGYSTTSHNHTGVYATASSNVATASALAANGANCAAGSYPLGVDASGAAENCTVAVGVFATATSNVATATALAANGANCPAGSYPLGVDASGAVESCTAAVGVFANMSSVIGSSSSGQVMYNANGVVGGLSGLTVDGSGNITMPVVMVVSAPTQTGSVGMHVLVTAGSTLAAGEVVYYTSNGNVLHASDGSTATMATHPLLIVESCNNNSTTCKALRYGFFKYPATQNYTVGATLYVANTAGSLTTTAPTVTARQLQVIGYAADSTMVWFDPDKTIIQLTN